MVTDHHKWGNGQKKLLKRLNIPFSTGAIIKRHTTYRMTANFPGRLRKCIVSPRIVRKMVREAISNPRISI